MLKLESVNTFFNEGAHLELEQSEVFKLKYKLQNKDYAGLIIPLAQSELGENFLVEFEIKGEPRNCKFERKLASKDTVWWIVKKDFHITEEWQSYAFKRRHFVYAWGSSQEFLESAKQIELVITAYEDCEGSFQLRNIKLTPVAAAKAEASNVGVNVSSGNSDFLVSNKPWVANQEKKQKIEINFHSAIELGGLVINWDEKTNTDFSLKIKDSKANIKLIDSIENFNGGSSFHYIPDCDASAIILELNNAKNCKINSLEFKGASFSSSWNAFLSNVALRKKRGLYPRYFYKEQSFWTVVAEDASKDKALINEEGLVEFGYNYPSIDAFINVDEKTLTWAESVQSQSLKDTFIPSVNRRYQDFELNITSYMNNNAVYSDYEIVNTSKNTTTGSLVLAIRPYQVNPPWQFLNTTGGFREINEIQISKNQALINNQESIYSTTDADYFYSNSSDTLVKSNLNISKSEKGTCSACFEYKFEIKPNQSNKWTLGTKDGNPLEAYSAAVDNWQNKFSGFNFSIQEETVKAQLQYIFSNRDGAAIQPGTRCYRRTWIRDGAMTSSALLQFGFFKEVKEFIEWFSPNILENGAVPCVVDSNGIDTTPEHDSHGEYLFLVSEYYRYTKDKDLIEKHFDKLVKVAKHIEELSALSIDKEPHIRGLLPKSISHEGYAANPAYSYWDDLWAVKGLQGLAYLASVLEKDKNYFQELSIRFEKIVLDSLDASMNFHKIDFIPGAADLGDFDATSTTIGADPCTLLLEHKKDALLTTMNRYWELFYKRENNLSTYTPYEIRVIGTFVRLGEIEKAWRALDFFLADRRPQGWLHWAEVVFAELREPGFLGDAPHGWVASDFLRAIRSVAIYELAGEYYIGAGITTEMWNNGVNCTLITPDGRINLKSENSKIQIDGPNGLKVWLKQNKEFKKVTLPFTSIE